MSESTNAFGQVRGVVAAWLLALAPAAMLAVLLVRPIWDVDVFWQLKLGELILANGAPLASEPFAANHLGEPMPAFAWLGQAIMAAVRLAAGWTGLRIFDALCWLGGFFAIAAACRRRSCSAAGVVLGLAIALFTALPTASLRPQSFAVLGFGLLLALLRLELRPWRTALFALPLFVIWQNLHPSVSVAAIALGTHAAWGWWEWLQKRGAAPWETTLLAGMAAAAMLATPDGWSILAWSGQNARASVAMGVSEWLPLWDALNRYGAVPVLLIAVVVTWLLLRNPHRIDPRELAVTIVFFAMTVIATRFVLFWAITLILVIARAVPPPPVERRLPAVIAPLALLVVAIAVPLLRPTHFEATIPLSAIDRLEAAQVRGTVFAHFPWGGPVIDRGHPDRRVAFDGRYYRYAPAEWDLYRRVSWDRVRLAEIERRYHPAAYVLSPEWNRALIAELRADKRWQVLFGDRVAVVFKRKSGATP
ncbi:hypothetical protein WG901_05500 [Novosphingobium sp. PS1R-30]|uniref:Glycosyltransferase RgtA/B/C/D-like domain-containing protein n=1 Tax=Novosphingobium anseongense TaxID=3133436 RepID=A0ABU8RSN3_9SPHN